MNSTREMSQYKADLVTLLGESRRRVDAETAAFSVSGPYGRVSLDERGADRFARVLATLANDLSFEHLDRDELEGKLCTFVAGYQSALWRGEKRAEKAEAAAFLRDNARDPEGAVVYIGVRHLSLPCAVEVGVARFLPSAEARQVDSLFDSKAFDGCSLFCAVEVFGGSDSRIVERALGRATLALSLLRLHIQQFLRIIPRHQLMFELHHVCVIERYDGTRHVDLRFPHQPHDLDLSRLPSDWATALAAEGVTISRLPPALRERVETALEWMDIASRAPTWKTKIPALFSGAESLIVPETLGRKDAVVTVRGVVLEHAANGMFSHPFTTWSAYMVRNGLVHGAPLYADVTGETEKLANDCEMWARDILHAYVKYAAKSTALTAKELVRELDRSEAASQARQWFCSPAVRGAEFFDEYLKVVATPGRPQ